MDEAAIEATGADADRARPRRPSTRSSIPTICRCWSRTSTRIGVPALFRFGAQTDLEDATMAIADVDQAGLGLPDRDYYLKTDARSVELREQVRRR